MISMYTGTPGSGKSYTAAYKIDLALKRGLPVIANFEINVNPKKHKGEFIYIDTLSLDPAFFMDYAEKHFDPRKAIAARRALPRFKRRVDRLSLHAFAAGRPGRLPAAAAHPIDDH